ncbi:cytosolic phospholipase A2-like isoform X3 [Orbicella faveolata]|uniref:cytosolic phospholipase A2-like isoform X2 n=1 Tax=Orbicella faveolata TaxID=48498 RepID=UPI0009E3883B|nr:cytosolic phospholipase A2-like isoform X2 [Orbicella faveolata]XP_020624407.1 cytosolic phospholipase A2-like isoform X3 [Orbicella faveolata]
MAPKQASFRPCLLLEIKVLRGRNITLGSFADWLDTPDPYVKLYIKTAPNGKRKTKVRNNSANPIWEEVFHFYLDPDMTNNLEITLMESDTFSDDLVETKTFDLTSLELNKVYRKTFVFRQTSEVDVELKVETSSTPTDMRYSMDLCEEENDFRQKRKHVVFTAMQKLLGERGPRTLDEVPSVAVLGSGGGFRAMVSLSGVFCALKDMGVLDCAMYTSGLSGSAWYLSTLYSHPDWPNVHPRQIEQDLRENIKDNWMWLLLTPSWLYNHMSIILRKRSRGQPVSFTDFFGYLVGETILKDRKITSKLSEQRHTVKDAMVPLPLYTCVHVKKDVSALTYCEWLEFSPYEIGMAKYGTFMKTEHFGSKFFCGKLLTPYPEPPLHYLQGIWGSAFTILLQRVLHEGKPPDDTIKSMRNTGDLRGELHGMINSENVRPEDDDEFSDEEEDMDATDGEETKEEAAAHDNECGDHSFLTDLMESFMEKVSFLKSRDGRAGLVHNFLRGLQLLTAPIPKEAEEVSETVDQLALKAKRIYLVDSGLVFNSPYPLLLRPQRDVDIFLSFDFSARDKDDESPFQELLLAEEWARKNNFKFPPIDATYQFLKDGYNREYYVFSDPNDPTCPVVVHFPLVNKTFKEQSKPGVPRKTAEELDFANFSIFEDSEGHYSTFNFHYTPKPFDRLTKLCEFNTLLGEQTIKDVMADCVRKRREGKAVNGMNGMNGNK